MIEDQVAADYNYRQSRGPVNAGLRDLRSSPYCSQSWMKENIFGVDDQGTSVFETMCYGAGANVQTVVQWRDSLLAVTGALTLMFVYLNQCGGKVLAD
jgi:ABC-type dipeptide/oligopeptide/nickel transport system permease subunit